MSINVNSNVISNTNFNTSGEIVNTPVFVTDGLVLWLDAGNNASYMNSSSYYDCGYGCQYYGSDPGCTNCSTQIKDMSGYGNDGTLSGATIVYDNYGGTMSFNGTTNFVQVSDSSSLTNTSTLSINIWFKLSAFDGALIGKGTSDTDEEYTIQVGATYIYFDVGIGSGPYTQPAASLSTDTWYNVSATHSRVAGSSTLIVYLNGVALAGSTVNPTNTPNDNSYPVSIGRRWYNSQSTPSNGKIAIVQIYNRTLSSTEVLQNFNAGRQRFGI